jgi:hypothetical protein
MSINATHDISASWDTLLGQSKDTAFTFFSYAKGFLEAQQVKYSTADVIALAGVMAHDFHASSVGVGAQKIASSLEEISTNMSNLNYALENVDHQALADALNAIAEAISDSTPSMGTMEGNHVDLTRAINAIAVAIAHKEF